MREKLRNTSPHIEKYVEDGEVFFTVFWSPLRKAEKYDIISKVPAQAGLFELYYMDDNHRLFPVYIQRVWYGGLRALLRKITDPDLAEDESLRAILETYDCFYRYTLTESNGDMLDILHFYSLSYLPYSEPPDNSGRYDAIYVEEISPDKIHDL